MVVVAVVVGVLFAVDIGVDILRRALHVEDSCTDQGSPAVAGLVGTEVGLAVVAVVVYSPTEIAGVGLVSAVGHAGAGKRDFPEAAAVRSFAVDSPHGRLLLLSLLRGVRRRPVVLRHAVPALRRLLVVLKQSIYAAASLLPNACRNTQ